MWVLFGTCQAQEFSWHIETEMMVPVYFQRHFLNLQIICRPDQCGGGEGDEGSKGIGAWVPWRPSLPSILDGSGIHRFKCLLHRTIKALSMNSYFVICNTVVGKWHISFDSRYWVNKEKLDGYLAPRYLEVVCEWCECERQEGWTGVRRKLASIVSPYYRKVKNLVICRK